MNKQGLTTKRLARIAIIAALEFVIFYSLSHVLYLEAITLTIISVALAFDNSDAILSSIIFGFILILYMGLTPWTIMYLIIYPCYSLLTTLLKKQLLKNEWLLIGYGFLLSAATGLILDLPFILLNKNVTIYYIITGLKTSVIQGFITAVEFTLIFDQFYNLLKRINK